jgi:hypothetical protein
VCAGPTARRARSRHGGALDGDEFVVLLDGMRGREWASFVTRILHAIVQRS